jgi:hypothetical protein
MLVDALQLLREFSLETSQALRRCLGVLSQQGLLIVQLRNRRRKVRLQLIVRCNPYAHITFHDKQPLI